MTRQVKVKDLREGDKVDLESCPHLSDHDIVEYEYGEISEIVVESDDCIVIEYANVSLTAGYDPECVLEVEDQ